jgi:hypothetical protein
MGAVGIGSAYLLLQYLRPKKKQGQQEQQGQQGQQEQQEQEEATAVEIVYNLPDDVAHICVNSAELEEIKQILLKHRKPFRILSIN